MAEPAQVQRRMTVDEFLEWDSGDDFVYELIDGIPTLKFPPNPDFHGQAAPSGEHATILMDLGATLRQHLTAHRRPCRVMAGNGQKLPRGGGRARIPDISVRCGRRTRDANDTVLVIEIASPSNTRVEILNRLEDYQSVDTVQEILLVEQDTADVQLYRRMGDLWTMRRATGRDGRIMLDSIGLDLPLSEIYRHVRLKEDAPDDDTDAEESDVGGGDAEAGTAAGDGARPSPGP